MTKVLETIRDHVLGVVGAVALVVISYWPGEGQRWVRPGDHDYPGEQP